MRRDEPATEVRPQSPASRELAKLGGQIDQLDTLLDLLESSLEEALRSPVIAETEDERLAEIPAPRSALTATIATYADGLGLRNARIARLLDRLDV